MATSGGALHTPPSGPQPSNPQTAPNAVGFDPKAAVPEQPIYVQRNDFIGFLLQSNITNCTVRINYRWLTPQGEIKEGTFPIGPFTGSLLTALPLYEGWLLSLAAGNTSGGIVGGWCFLQASIVRAFGSPSGPFTYGVFWQGYMYQNASIGWPGVTAKEITDGAGTLRSITGTTPAAGAEINEVVPLNRRWNLLSIRATLTTSATVANRFPGFSFDDAANTLFISRANAAQTATQVVFYTAVPGLTFYNDTVNGIILPFPQPTSLRQSFRIHSNTTGLQAGDQWSAPQYLVQEWGIWDP